MRRRGGADFVLGLGQVDQQAALVARAASEQKLQCQRGLAGAWSALDKMHGPRANPPPRTSSSSSMPVAARSALSPAGIARFRLDRAFFGDERLPGALVQTT